MKIIDLLNLIAKGEEVPKEIKYKNENLYFDYETTNYFNDEDMHSLFCSTQFILNDEVEIIEEEKEIEKIIISMDDTSMPYVTNNKYQKISYSEVDLLFASKINELIDEINKLKRDKE